MCYRHFVKSMHPSAVGGTLIFDVHSTFKTDVIFMEGPFTFDNGRIAYIWKTEEGEDPHSVYSELAFFIKERKWFV